MTQETVDRDSGKWSLPLYTSRPVCYPGDLCVACEESFPYILFPHTLETLERKRQDTWDDISPSYEIPPLGWLDRILTTKNCDLCRFITELAGSLRDLDMNSFNRYDRINCVVTAKDPRYLREYSSHAPHALRKLNLTRVREIIEEGVSRWVKGKSQSICFALDQSTLRKFLAPRGRSAGETILVSHVGRKIPNDIDPGFLKNCYKTCQEYHRSSCHDLKFPISCSITKETRAQSSLRSVRVIDTKWLKLVDLPDGADFVALSYTWSTMSFVSLLLSTKESLSKGRKLDKVPPAISDSIQVVRWIGERYLWADRLCIIQDCPVDKRIQLAQMDQLYHQATLTIVAAASEGDGIDKGLPGVRKGTRSVQQATTTIRQNIRLTQNRSNQLSRYVERSHWSTRAWTYQEDMMSKRQLVFLPHQVAFFCQRSTFNEDRIHRLCLPNRQERDTACGQSEEAPACCQYKSSGKFNSAGGAMRMSSDLGYTQIVQQYTTRQLTVPTDVLDAINGLLRVMTKMTAERFLCGLPLTLLVTDWLTWIPDAHSERRQRVSFGADANQNVSPFLPSWSWAGWIGGVLFVLSNRGFRRTAPCIGFRSLVAGDYTVLIPGSQEDVFTELRREEVFEQLQLRTNFLFIHSPLQHSRLRFSAPTARMRLAPTFWGHHRECSSSVLHRSVSRAHQIFISSSFAGSIVPHIPSTTSASDLRSQTQDFRESLCFQHCGCSSLPQVELIALSEGNKLWEMYYPYNTGYVEADENYFYVAARGNQKPHVPYDWEVWPLGEEESGRVVNVLMIEWNDDEGGMLVARRTGVGQVHRDAWEMAGPQLREIVLG